MPFGRSLRADAQSEARQGFFQGRDRTHCRNSQRRHILHIWSSDFAKTMCLMNWQRRCVRPAVCTLLCVSSLCYAEPREPYPSAGEVSAGARRHMRLAAVNSHARKLSVDEPDLRSSSVLIVDETHSRGFVRASRGCRDADRVHYQAHDRIGRIGRRAVAR